MLPGVAPAASASRVDAPCTAWGVGNSCYYPNCTVAHKAGEGNIPSTSPHYCRNRTATTMTMRVIGKPKPFGRQSLRGGAHMLLKSALRSLSAAGLAATIGAFLLAPEPTVRADPVATTAVVLKVVDGDTVDIRDDVRGRRRIRLLGIDTPETKKPGYSVGSGVRRQASSRSLACSDNESPSSPIRARACTTASAGPWPTWTRPTDGITRSKRPVRVRPNSYVYHGHPSARASEIAAAGQEAKAAGRGLWGPPCFGETTSVPQ